MRLEGKWMKEFIFTRTGSRDEEVLGYAYVKRWLGRNYVVIIDNCSCEDIRSYVVTDAYFDFIDSIFDDNRSYHLSYHIDAIFIEPAECFIVRRVTFNASLCDKMDVNLIIDD